MPEIKFVQNHDVWPYPQRPHVDSNIKTFERIKRFADYFGYPEITVSYLYKHQKQGDWISREKGSCWFQSPRMAIEWIEHDDGTIGVDYPNVPYYGTQLGRRLRDFISKPVGGTISIEEFAYMNVYMGVTNDGDLTTIISWNEIHRRGGRVHQIFKYDEDTFAAILGLHNDPSTSGIMLDYIEGVLKIPVQDHDEMIQLHEETLRLIDTNQGTNEIDQLTQVV